MYISSLGQGSSSEKISQPTNDSLSTKLLSIGSDSISKNESERFLKR